MEWIKLTEVNDLNEARALAGAGASNTASLAFSGIGPSTSVNTELWNGSSWTEVNNVNAYRGFGSGTGTSTSALFFGGGTASDGGNSNSSANESWNGTNWTEVGDMAAGRSSMGSQELIVQALWHLEETHLRIQQTQNLGMDRLGLKLII